MKSSTLRWIANGAIGFAALAMPILFWPTSGSTPLVMSNDRQDQRVSLMTYNIEGLPWPVRFGRSSALTRIGDRLSAMRRLGEQPHIVVLQEAFSYDAKRIGLESGYRYIANGPGKDLRGVPAVSPADIAFEAGASFLHGERSGKLVDSGLQILSDYPILSIRRMAFPAYACAGYDCLANKGALLVTIAVPGRPAPIAVVDVHLNSHRASGASETRSIYAYRRQIDAIDAFLASSIAPGTPTIVAGDFNVGHRENRRAYLESHFRHWSPATAADGSVRDALTSCLSEAAPCGSAIPTDARFSFRRARDWQLSVPGADDRLGVAALAVPFGHDIDGSMLSDHVGYTAYYDVVANRPALAAHGDQG